MTFLLIMGMVVLVLLGAISLLAASAAGRFDPADEGAPLRTSGAEVTWSAISVVVGGFLVVFAILGALLQAEPSWLSSVVFGVLYVYRGIQGLRA